METSTAGEKKSSTEQPEATPSLLKSSHLLPWQHYVFCLRVRARWALCVTMDTYTALANSWSRCSRHQGDMERHCLLVSSQPRYSRLGWRTLKRGVCAFVCPAAICSLDWTCAAAGGSPFQACYLLLNKSAASDAEHGRTKSE